GSKLGKGLSIAFAAVAVFEVVKTYTDMTNQLNEQTAKIISDSQTQIKEASAEALRIQRDGLAQGIKDLDEFAKHDPVGAWIAGVDRHKAELVGQFDATVAELAKRGEAGGHEFGEGFGTGVASGIDQSAPAIRDHLNTSVNDAA